MNMYIRLNALLDAILIRKVPRLLISFILLLLYYNQLIDRPAITVAIRVMCILIYLLIIWLPKARWSASLYFAATAVLMVLVIPLYFVLHDTSSTELLWALVCMLAAAPVTLVSSTSILALTTILTVTLLSWTGSFPYSTFLGVIGLYLGLRGRRALQEVNRLNQERLIRLNETHEELEIPHEELQNATLEVMQHAALTERNRLAREIHDGLGHRMTSLIIQLQALELMLPGDPKRASGTVAQLLAVSREGMKEIRMSVHEWAGDDKDMGLTALRGLVSQTAAGSNIHFMLKEEGEFSEWPSQISITAFRLLQEAITNVLRHSGATEVQITLREQEEQLLLEISDNGANLDQLPAKSGFGLQGMEERCRSAGGTCSFSVNLQGGLKVVALLPLGEE